MKDNSSISLKSEETIIKKKKLNLALNILISALGISSLFIKIFLKEGVLAFRYFTIDGNLFTTVVSVIAVFVNFRELRARQESGSRRLFFLQLASAVTEAVIFIVVMVGFLPVFPDKPTVTPCDSFCLHVAIPILAVLRFIFFEKPQGILKPGKLLMGAIPIGVYGVGVVTAIKLGILPTSLAPYSFLDFDSYFLWYFFFALTGIPSVSYLWSWLFYRLNIRASFLWYSAEDLEKLKKARVKELSSFDGVNSAILLIFLALAVVVIMFALMGTSNTATQVQQEMMSYVSFYMSDDYDHMMGSGVWHMENGVLYKGDMAVGDGTEENANKDILTNDTIDCDATIFVQAKELAPEIAAKYEPTDYVAVEHSAGNISRVYRCGETLERDIAEAVMTSESHSYYEEVTIDGESYFHHCKAFGKTMYGSGVGIISMYFPSAEMTAQVKNAEYNTDIMIIAVVIAIFAVLYVVATVWIRTLEKSVDFLKAIASGRVPEEPIKLGRTLLLSGLERDLNVLREINRE